MSCPVLVCFLFALSQAQKDLHANLVEIQRALYGDVRGISVVALLVVKRRTLWGLGWGGGRPSLFSELCCCAVVLLCCVCCVCFTGKRSLRRKQKKPPMLCVRSLQKT